MIRAGFLTKERREGEGSALSGRALFSFTGISVPRFVLALFSQTALSRLPNILTSVSAATVMYALTHAPQRQSLAEHGLRERPVKKCFTPKDAPNI